MGLLNSDCSSSESADIMMLKEKENIAHFNIEYESKCYKLHSSLLNCGRFWAAWVFLCSLVLDLCFLFCCRGCFVHLLFFSK